MPDFKLLNWGSSGAVEEVNVTTPVSGTAEIDFGVADNDFGVVTVLAAWVSSGSVITATPKAVSTDDHDPDDYAAESLVVYITNIIPGVSFDIVMRAPNLSFGKYLVNWVGM